MNVLHRRKVVSLMEKEKKNECVRTTCFLLLHLRSLAYIYIYIYGTPYGTPPPRTPWKKRFILISVGPSWKNKELMGNKNI